MAVRAHKGEVVELRPAAGGVAAPSCFVHRLAHSSEDPCCHHCHTFSRTELQKVEAERCCGSVTYCPSADCAQKHYIDSHWLLCEADGRGKKQSQEHKELLAYLSDLQERIPVIFAANIVASIVSSALVLWAKDSQQQPRDLLETQLQSVLNAYPDPTANGKTCEDIAEETFALLCALILNDRLLELWTRLHLHNSWDDIAVFGRALHESFTLARWVSLLRIVDCYSIELFSESPFLKNVQALPRLSTSLSRSSAFAALESLAEPAGIFLTACSQVPNKEATASEKELYQDRALNLLAQGATMANQSGDRATLSATTNPFDGCGLLVSVLVVSPPFFPSQLKSGGIVHSCCGNLGAEVASLSPFRVRFKAQRDIAVAEDITFDFSKSRRPVPGSVELGSHAGLHHNRELPCVPCQCPLCALQQNPFKYLAPRIPNLLVTSKPSWCYETLISFTMGSARSAMDELSSLMLLAKTQRSPSPFRESTLKRLVELRLVADVRASDGKFLEAVVLYSTALCEALCSLRTADQSIEDDSPLGGLGCCAEMCISLGTIIFESLISQAWASSALPSSFRRKLSSPLGLDHSDMEAVYRLGLWLSPQNEQLQERVTKLDAYRTKPQDAVLHVDSQCFAEGVFGTKSAEIPDNQCNWVVVQAEKHATKLGGWTTSRHYSVPTTDLPVHHLPEVCSWFADVMTSKARALISQSFFQGQPINLVVNDAFIVKYQGDDNGCEVSVHRQRSLPLHSDQSTHSFTIALNDCSEYEGGGTYFAHLKKTFRVSKGQLLCFRGNHLHGGDAVLSGTRYIIAAFVVATPLANVAEDVDPDVKRQKIEVFEEKTDGFTFNFF